MNSPARIGPNSIIQTVAALDARYGTGKTDQILDRIGQASLRANLPKEMVEEEKFHTLCKSLENELGAKELEKILEDSGMRTAAYLLKVRIPGFFQAICKPLPAGLAFKLLFFAISKNAWTFAGSGEFSYTKAKSPTITVKVTASSVPTVGYFYLGTFTKLLRELVNPEATVEPVIRRKGSSIVCTYSCRI